MYHLLGESHGVVVDESESAIHFQTEEEAEKWAEEQQMRSYQIMEGELRPSDCFLPKRESKPADEQRVCPYCRGSGLLRDDRHD